MAKGQSRICKRVAGHGNPDFGVKGADAVLWLAPSNGRTEMLGQKSGGLKIQRLQPRDGGGGVGKAFCARRLRGQDGLGLLLHGASRLRSECLTGI
jgi:hypothetical protein